jgi:hypothetical protein
VSFTELEEDARGSAKEVQRLAETALGSQQRCLKVEEHGSFHGFLRASLQRCECEGKRLLGPAQVGLDTARVRHVAPGAGTQVFEGLLAIVGGVEAIQDFKGEQGQAFAQSGVQEVLFPAAAEDELAETPGVESRAVAEEEGPLFRGMLGQLGEERWRIQPFLFVGGLYGIQVSGDSVQGGLVVGCRRVTALQWDHLVRQSVRLWMEQRT